MSRSCRSFCGAVRARNRAKRDGKLYILIRHLVRQRWEEAVSVGGRRRRCCAVAFCRELTTVSLDTQTVMRLERDADHCASSFLVLGASRIRKPYTSQLAISIPQCSGTAPLNMPSCGPSLSESAAAVNPLEPVPQHDRYVELGQSDILGEPLLPK